MKRVVLFVLLVVGIGLSQSDPFRSTSTRHNRGISAVSYDSQAHFLRDTPDGWTCEAFRYNASDGCDCDCGIQDLDCSDPIQPIFNCDPFDSDNGLTTLSCVNGTCNVTSPPSYIPDDWICPVAWYDNGICDCQYCSTDDTIDPDCNNKTLPVNCGDGNYTCVENTCISSLYPIPSDWTCSVSLYNSSGNCDCDCGVQDPDCDDPTAIVENCFAGVESYNRYFKCLRGACIRAIKPPTRLVYGSAYSSSGEYIPITVAACGKFLRYLVTEDKGSGRIYTSAYPLAIGLQDEDWNPWESRDSATIYTVKVSARSKDPANPVILAGKTSSRVNRKGFAFFPEVLVIGASDAEFDLIFTSDPPLIPTTSDFGVALSKGDPSGFNFAYGGQITFQNKSFSVASEQQINAKLVTVDDCNNVVSINDSLFYSNRATCQIFDHVTGVTDPFDNNSCIFNSDTNITINFPSWEVLSDYDITAVDVFFNAPYATLDSTIYAISGVYTFAVTPKGEYQCYRLQDPSVGITDDDITNFGSSMIDAYARLYLSDSLFSTGKQRANLIQFDFVSPNNTPSYQLKVDDQFKSWVLSGKAFFVEQDPTFLRAVSVNLVDVEPTNITVRLMKPFCASMIPQIQKAVIGRWVYSLADAYALSQATKAISNGNFTGISVQSAYDISCYLDPTVPKDDNPQYTCCPRLALLYDGKSLPSQNSCTAPKRKSLTIALIVLSVCFAAIAAGYAVSLAFVFFKQSGAIRTAKEEVEIIKSTSAVPLAQRRRESFLVVVFAPVIVVFALIQNEFMNANVASRVLLAIFSSSIVIFWWIISSYRFYEFYIAFRRPTIFVDYAWIVALLILIFYSVFNVCLTFAWVTLGLLLDPEKVAAYFVGFLTIITVVLFKIQALSLLLKETEARLHRRLFKFYTGAKGEVSEDDFNTVEALSLEEDELTPFFIEKGLSKENADAATKKISSFRTFRVRFLVGNLFGTTITLVALIIFILLGVEAFRLDTGVVTSIGSVLEGAAGASTVISDKLGDKEGEVNDMLSRFMGSKSTKKYETGLPRLDRESQTGIELQRM